MAESALYDPERLGALRATQLLDSPVDPSFDRLTRLVQHTLHVPTALITLVDAERQFIKSSAGLAEPWHSARQTPLSHAFCQYVVVNAAPLVIDDTRIHPLGVGNHAIKELHVIAYAGVPLRTPQGYILGSLCAIDYQPRTWQDADIVVLTDLAALVISEIELRQIATQAQQQACEIEQRRDDQRALLERITDAVISVDYDWRITALNQEAARQMRRPYAELLGSNLWRMLPEAIGNPFYAAAYRALATQQPTTALTHVTEHGVWGESFFFPDRNGLSIYIRDVTERVQAERALRDSEVRYRQLFESNPEAMWVFDPATLAFLAVNDAAIARYGYSRDEFLRMTIRDIRPSEDVEHLEETVARAIKIYTGQWRHQKKDGTLLWVEIHAQDVLLDGRAARIVAARDVTAQRRSSDAQQLLAAAGEALSLSLDYTTTLRSVAEVVVPLMADWCAIDVVDADGAIQRVVVHHYDSTKQALADELRRSYPPDPAIPGSVPQVLHTGQSEIIASYSANTYGWSRDARHQQIIEQLGTDSLMRVPLRARGQTLGVLTLGSAAPGRRYDSEDLALAEELGRRAATAIDNACLHHAAQAAAQRSGETLARLDALLASASIGIAFLDRDLRYVQINDRLAAINMVAAKDHLGKTVREILPHSGSHIEAQLQQVLASGEPIVDQEIVVQLPDQQPNRYYVCSYYPIRTADGQILGVGAMVLDTTERRRLETELLQAQKIDSIGRLAGGVAHDFNNLLTAIMGFADLALYMLPPDNEVTEELGNIKLASKRAADLTNQLLAFARKQKIEPRTLNLNDLVLEIDKLLRRLIGENITLETLPAPDLGQIKADPGQLEQVLVNLLVNARDAMPGGGVITIQTRNVTLDEHAASHHPDLLPGSYVLLTVNDTGMGMSAEVQKHVFEPFFTTKPPGQGTGLGLATVYGIVKQHGGCVQVTSALNHGTTVAIYLPLADNANTPDLVLRDSQPLPSGTETILLVEDDPAVRTLAQRILSRLGYTVLEADNGDEALRHAARQPQLDLLLTDIVLPQRSGTELATHVLALHPQARVLFTSGYGSTLPQHTALLPSQAFLPKPFVPTSLAHTVRLVLDGAM